MADNVNYNPTGTTAIATDDASGVHFQRVKLVDGTMDSTAGIPGDATNGLDVDVTRVAGGGVAHDSVDSGNPIKIGARSVSSLASATMVAAADRSDLVSDLDGTLLTRPWVPLGDILSERVTDATGTATNFTAFGATAGARNFITTIIGFNDSTTNGFVDILDGSVPGTVLMTLPLPAKGGSVINLPIPLRQPTANNALRFDVSAALTTVYITLIGFKSKA